MKRIQKNIALFFLIYLISIHNISLNNNTNWWDECLGKTVSYELFAQWIGDAKAASKVAVRTYIKQKNYSSVLDIPCGLCFDYFGFKQDNISIEYTGMDICNKLISIAKEKNINANLGSIEEIDYQDNSFDVVYSRHILEHLNSYEKAVSEIIRVAKKEALIVFFIKPSESNNDIINLANCNGYPLYHNTYSKNKFVKYVLSNPKVTNIVWQHIDNKEAIAHILLAN